MLTIVSILIILASILLVAVVFIQNPKGGGLSSDFGGQQLGGVQKTNDFVEKATWTLAALIMVGAIAVSSMMKPAVVKDNTPKATEQPGQGAPQAPQAPGQ
ncbi:MAG: preprotein translocase subunit SecG [Fluviicola sp.]|nr:preprotein translocase subunit SecG [Fluviicola sp.]MBP6272360.1 preprotein translocase subunit SecG [Fluviicola sp.]